MQRFHAIHFGCRANQADGAAVEEELSQRGLQAVADSAEADVVVLNSCTVTAAADYELRQTVRRIRRENPQAHILVTGCYAQRRPEDLAALPGVRWIVGNAHKTEIGRLLSEPNSPARDAGPWVPLEKLLAPASQSSEMEFHTLGSPLPNSGPLPADPAPQILVGDISAVREFLTAPVVGKTTGDRTRPNLKIQEGCNNRCSFCIIPSVRGRSRSLPVPEVLHRVRALCRGGYREVVFSGINLGRYGRDLPQRIRFAELVRMILEETPLERLRLSSVEPMDFTDELLDRMAASPRIAKHVHAPLQSGSDRILRRMHRKYHPWNYRDRILAACQRMPNAAFGADVMVGFPGETDEDFEETRRLIESLPFTYLHVFPFSRRPGTPADAMKEQIHGAVVRERSRILRELAAQKNRRFRERQVGQILRVLTLEEEAEGGAWALSDNYLKVFIPGERLPGNRLRNVRMVSLSEGRLVGECVAEGFSQSRDELSPSITTCARA